MAGETTTNTIKTVVELDVTKAQQEIVKLNNAASDSTKTLEERVAAKNKQVQLQKQLSEQTINGLKREVTQLEKAGASEKQLLTAKTKLNKAKVSATKLSESNTKAQSKLTESLRSSKSATENLDKASGGLLGKFKLLATNPIGAILIAIVGAVTLLTSALSSSEEGQNKMAKASAILGSILNNVMDIVSELANFLFDAFSNPQESIEKLGQLIKDNLINRFNGLLELLPQLGKAINQLFNLEFSKAAETAGNAVAKVALGVEDFTGKIAAAGQALADLSDEVAEDARKAAAIADKRAMADRAERDLIVQKAEAERKIAELRDIAAKKDSVSAEERKKAIEEASAISDAITLKEIAAAKMRADALILENTLSNSNKEALQAEEEAKAKVIRLETQRLKLQKALSAELSTIGKEQEALDNKAIAAAEKKKADEEAAALLKNEGEKEKRERELEAQLELDALDIERRRTQGENVLALELELLEKRRLQEVSQADLLASEVQAINEKAELAKQRLRKTTEKAEQAKEDALLESAIGGAAQAFGVAQEVAVAKMIMNAPEAISNVWTQAAKQPTLPMVAIHGIGGSAMTLAPIIQGLSDIKNTRFSKKKGAAPSGTISSSSGGSSNPSITPELVSDISANNSARVGLDTSLGNNASATASNNVMGGSSNNIVFSESKYDDFKNQVQFKEDKVTI